MEAVTGATRNAVWQEMLDVARLVRYYDRMARRQQQRHLGIRIVLFASATAGVASAIAALPEAVRTASGALIALLVAWDFLADYANKAAILGVIRGECSEVERTTSPSCGAGSSPTRSPTAMPAGRSRARSAA